MSSVYSFQPGVIYDENDKFVSLFIDLVKKESTEEHLMYGDKFLTKNKFVWESQTETTIGNSKYNRLMKYEKAKIFVRKFQQEDTISLPYVYLGEGKLTDPRPSTNKKKSVLFDIILDTDLTDSLFEQFNIETNETSNTEEGQE